MTPAEILDLLGERGVKLWVEGDRIRYRAPKDALTPELSALLSENKDAVRELLRKQAARAVATHPQSHGQRSLWFLHQEDPTSSAYHTTFSVRIKSEVDDQALERAYQTLVDRHPTLRTTLTVSGGRPVQLVHGDAKVGLERVDARDLTLDELREQVIERYRRPFDLENGPVIRVHLFTRGPADHVLLHTIHHAAVDGWSILLLLQDLSQIYGALVTGEPMALPAKRAQYVDFAHWQAEMLAGEEGARLWEYWSDRLAGPLPTLELPTDRPRPRVRSSHGASHGITLDRELAARLNELARSETTTLFVVLLSGFYVLLHRYTGQDDLLIGSPTAGRDRPEFMDVVGDFMNTMVLRTSVAEDPTFRQLLARVRETVLGAIDHQSYPFSLLVERLQPKRDPSRTPVFEVLFNLQKFDRFNDVIGAVVAGRTDAELELGGLDVEVFDFPQQEGQFDLHLELNDLGDELVGALRYNTDLFDAETIARMAGHLERLLEGAVTDPEVRVSELRLLTESELHEQLVEWNASEAPYPRDATVSGLVSRQARETPDHVAVSFEGASLTYGELEERAGELARHLRSLGVGPGVLVGVALERSLEMVVALLGVLEAGGAYLPLDPTFPSGRLAYMLEDSEAAVLVTERSLVDELPEHEAEVVCLDGDLGGITAAEATQPAAEAGPEDLAYVIYTSGSTGRPKGVQIPHRAVVNFLESMRREPGLGPEDVLLSVTTLSFDISVLEIFLPLTVGARLELVSSETASHGEALAERLASSSATAMQATPTTWRMLIEWGWQGDGRLKAMCGGEAWSRELADQLVERCGSVWNMYGPTETTIWSAVRRIEENGRGPVCVGRPIANTQLYVLDEGLRPVPIGVPGELCIGGVGVARGYLKRPELTAERFVADPFSGEEGARVYRTGDRVRYRPDGSLEFQGRFDHQVKIRGFRIELGEIETLLRSHEAVRDVAVAVRADRLVAFVVFETGADLTVTEVRRFVGKMLPRYMVPSTVVPLNALPLTLNRKVDREALPDPFGRAGETTEEHVPPSTAEERLVAEVWEGLLGIDSVGAHDNFFEVGGHSLLSVQAVREIEKRTGHRLNPRVMFFQSLEQIASTLAAEPPVSASE